MDLVTLVITLTVVGVLLWLVTPHSKGLTHRVSYLQ
jgi:hypothetical protein